VHVKRTTSSLAAAVLLAAAVVATSAAQEAPPPEPCAAAANGQAPRRVISVVPAVTEILFDIGAGPRVVAVSSFDEYPADVARLPRVGALLDPDLEAILRLTPDLVVVYASQTDLRLQLDRAKIPMFVYAHAGLADIPSVMRALGACLALDREAAQAAGRLETRLEGVRTRVRSRARPKTLLVFGRDRGTLRSIYASGGVGFLHDVLELAGGDNVFGDTRRQSVQLSLEGILARAPELILELRYTEKITQEIADREAAIWSTLGSIPAVRTGRVHVLVGDQFVVPGPRIGEAAEQIARTLHPEAFAR
jgi:iron complex transport system substrate-binding protein